MAARHARPVYVLPNNGGADAHIGTGFIVVASDLTAWLVTAAHIPTMQNHPTLDFSRWPSGLHFVNHANGAMEASLFHDLGSTRIPTFRFLPGDSGTMADMMALPLPAPFLAHLDPSTFISFRSAVTQRQPLGPVSRASRRGCKFVEPPLRRR